MSYSPDHLVQILKSQYEAPVDANETVFDILINNEAYLIALLNYLTMDANFPQGIDKEMVDQMDVVELEKILEATLARIQASRATEEDLELENLTVEDL